MIRTGHSGLLTDKESGRLIHKEFQQGSLNKAVAVKTSLDWTVIGNYGLKHKESIHARFRISQIVILCRKTPIKFRSSQIVWFCEIHCFGTKVCYQKNMLTPSEMQRNASVRNFREIGLKKALLKNLYYGKRKIQGYQIIKK